jgi:hypothetical protein
MERIDTALAHGANKWTHPGTGETRYYLDEWPALAGIDITRNRKNRIESASMDGRTLSKAAASSIVCEFTVWLDSDGQVHAKGMDTRGLTPGDIASRVADGLDALVEQGQ